MNTNGTTLNGSRTMGDLEASIAAAAEMTKQNADTGNAPVFTAQEVEDLLMRRLNPLPQLTAATLTSALDAFDLGELAPAARLWEKLATRDRWLKTVKDKREEALELRPMRVECDEDTPEAKDQQRVLEVFLANIRATHALQRHVAGGASLLLRQMAESISYLYAAHHLRWEPDAAQTFALPGGREVPVLRLTCELVPLEYFEARSGALRFLGGDTAWTGQPMRDGEWMITTGPCLMQAASIALYEARLARHDRLNLSEKWGQPAILGHTTAAKNSTEGNAMKTAVTSVAGNYRGVIYGAQENKLEPFWPTGGGSGSGSPMKEILDDVRREVTTLYLGSDLSTISREKSVGASIQGDSLADRQAADCLRTAGALNAQLVPLVIAWYFGEGARVLAKFVIEPPSDEDRAALIAAVQAVVEMGGQVPVAPVAKRLQVPIAKAAEEVFQKPAKLAIGTALNTAPQDAPRGSADSPALGKLFAQARDFFPAAIAKDLQPLRTALAAVLHGDDAGLPARAAALQAKLREPAFVDSLITSAASSDALFQILSAAAAQGLATTAP